MSKVKPIIFLAFANDQDDRERYLRNLPRELRELRQALDSGRSAGLWDVVERANATIDDILDVFQNGDHRNRIAVFHFGGHAGSYQLLLETAAGQPALAGAAGLAAFLGQQRGLQLVFLNGCSTGPQVQALLEANVSAVIATSRSIDDQVATSFASRFYRGLASRAGVQVAFDEATASLRTHRGDSPRDLYREEATEGRWPWELSFRQGAEEAARRWSLVDAAGDPLFGLPAVPRRDLPNTPYRHLHWFTREHAEVFFGRGREIRDLYERVTNPESAPIVLLYGQSGVGKSSLLEAGVLPRLESSHTTRYARRDQQLGLLGSFAAALGAEAASTSLRQAWLDLEASSGRPLVVILDQVEEVYSRPTGQPNELQDWLSALGGIFQDPQMRPSGKLILGFRKEWLAEIESQLAEYGLPQNKVFLARLDRTGIVEAISGPDRVERLRKQYGLTIEEGLPEIIADDLLEDEASQIAPVLQILLTKMWDEATRADATHPHFDRALYQMLKEGGILLKHFLDQQLNALGKWRSEVVSSGLVLDLLTFHTTALGTAEQKSGEELADQYSHRKDVLPELLQRCQDLYLLVDPSEDRGGDEGDRSTRLAHDTLAPLIRQRCVYSDYPGQRARRILENRAVDWSKDRVASALDEIDLELVERGAGGMRVCTADEQRLMDASRKARAGRQRRHRRQQLGAVVALVLILASAGAAWWQRGEMNKARLAAESRELASRSLRSMAEDRTMVRTLVLAIGAVKKDETYEAEAALRNAVDNSRPQGVLKHGGIVTRAAFSPDGQRVVTVNNRRARLWRTETGVEESVLGQDHRGIINNAEFSLPDGRRLVTSSGDRTARIWDVRQSWRRESAVLRHNGSVAHAAFSPDGRRVLTASWDTTARLWDATTGKEVVTFRGHADGIRYAAFSPDGRRVVTASEDGTAGVWHAESGRQEAVLQGHTQGLTYAEFSPLDGRWIATASKDGTARVWKTATGETVTTLRHAHPVIHLAFSPNGQRVATVSEGGTVELWEVPTGRSVATFRLEGSMSGAGSKVATRAAFSPDGRRLATAWGDGTARLWDVETGRETAVLRGHRGMVNDVAFSAPDGRWVVTAGADSTAHVFVLPIRDLVAQAESLLPRDLTPEERERMLEP